MSTPCVQFCRTEGKSGDCAVSYTGDTDRGREGFCLELVMNLVNLLVPPRFGHIKGGLSHINEGVLSYMYHLGSGRRNKVVKGVCN